jgi:3-oxoacyl-[acyl-carrier-protein] synthase-3
LSIGIRAISRFVPEQVVTNDSIVAAHGFDEAFIRDKLGIAERHIAAPDEYVSDLAVAAGTKLIEEHHLDRGSIGLLILVTQTPDTCLPHVSATIQNRLGLPTTVAAFDISLGCSGYVYGLATAIALMEAQGIENGILLTAETYSKIMSPDDRATAPLFGDAATATLLSRDPIYRCGRFVFGTDGGRASALTAHGLGVRQDRKESLFMNGAEIFAFVMGSLPRHIDECLSLNGVEREQIDAWLLHQASKHMLTTLAPRLKIAKDRLVLDMSDVGNTTSSTIPIALERRILAAENKPNRVLLSGFGVGLSWASTVITLAETTKQ